MDKKKQTPPPPPEAPRELDRIKSSVMSRGLSLARLGIGASAQFAGRGMAQLWENKDSKDERWKAFFAGQAKNFSQEIGELKGSLMKAGQMMSMLGEHFFPPEVNQFLKSLQQESPPVKWSVIEEILKKELGAEKMALLEIETKALASASMGQVHKAKIKSTGEVVALKVQYPGVDKAIDSDLRAMKAFLNILKVLPKNFDTAPMFEEVRKMLVQETDYTLEADWTEKYLAALQGDSRFVVPRVYREFSNKRILATSFESGVRADDPLIQALSQERRNRLGENFLDVYFRELYEWNLVQTDPHAGNYKVRLRPDGQDQWVLLDFGATRQYPKPFVEAYRQMIKASLNEDKVLFRKASEDLKFLHESDEPALVRLFEELCFMIVEPFRGQVFDWKNTDLPQRTTQKALEIIKAFAWRTPPSEIIFLDRKTGGVFIMMNILGAKINARQVLVKHMGSA